MITRGILILMFVLGSISCSRRDGEQKVGLVSHLVSITDNEEKGIKEILDYYGGECEYSIGFVESTKDNEDKKFFEIELRNTEVIGKYVDKPEFIGSNIAFRFFKNLNEEERQNYSHIRGTVVSENGRKMSYDFSREILTSVEKKVEVVENVIQLIKEKRFEDIGALVNPEDVFDYDKNQIVNGLKKVDPQLGNIQEFRLFGFKFTSAGGKGVLNISGMLVRDIQSTEFKVLLNPGSEKEEILMLDYKW